jgi:mono/diheme cytochrome c family protein
MKNSPPAKHFILNSATWATLLTLQTHALAADSNAASLFAEKCSGCHTIGQGNLVGPDLKSVATWEDRQITEDVRRMQKMAGPLTEEEIVQLAGFLKKPTGTAQRPASSHSAVTGPGTNTVAAAASETKTLEEPGSAEVGLLLFSGRKPFENGGMSCISCHSAGGLAGGSLGADLTNVSQRMNEQALIMAAEKAPYPVMKNAYEKHPVTHTEAIHVGKFLSASSASASKKLPLVMYGLGLSTAFFVFIAFAYRNRNAGVLAKLKRRR